MSYQSKNRYIPCAECGKEFEQKRYTRRKYCDLCVDAVKIIQRAANRKKAQAKKADGINET